MNKCIVLLFMFLSGTVHSQVKTTFLCVSSDSIGYTYKSKGSWEPAFFQKNEPAKYLIKYENLDWTWTKFGETRYLPCNKPELTTGDVVCPNNLGQFVFNIQSMRFIRSYLSGYVSGDEKSNTPSITIGKCSPI